MELVRNAILTDPETGARRVLKAGQEVDDATAALLDPRAFATDPVAAAGSVGEAGGVPVAALRAYAEGRGLIVPAAASGFDILGLLVDADERLAAGLAVDNGDGSGASQVGEVLEGNVEEVNAYLDAHPQDVAAVLAAEAAGRDRKGIVEGPHAQQQE